MVGRKITNEELERIIEQADKEYDDLKDRVHDLFFKNKELKERIDKAIEEINYMITNADITEIGAIKLKQILGDKEWQQ